jgi:hypothetical protein
LFLLSVHAGTIWGLGEGIGPVASVRYDDGSVREFALGQLRLADFGDSVPWRQVRSLHGQAHYSGSYASATMGGFVVYERPPGACQAAVSRFVPQVRGIYAQPFLLVARAGGRVRRHVPDFLLVHLRNRCPCPLHTLYLRLLDGQPVTPDGLRRGQAESA